MSKIIISIKGMHCRSCELLVKDELSQLAGVKKVDVSSKTHQAELIVADDCVDEAELAAAVRRAGYEVGSSESLPIFTQNQTIWQQVFLMAILVSLGTWITHIMGWQNGLGLSFGGQPASLLGVLVIGLTAGVSTCMALVGGLIMAISAQFAKVHQKASFLTKLEPILAFQAGRLVGFLILGGLLGWLGGKLELSPLITSVLSLTVAGVMVILGLQLTGLFPRLASFSFALPSWLADKLGLKNSQQTNYSFWQTALTGSLTFFVPCGFTQSMQLFAASTGSPARGAMIMAIFALGTLPGLSLIGSLGSITSGKFSKLFTRLVGVMVVTMALSSLVTSWNLLTAANSSGGVQIQPAENPGEVQEIRMVQRSNGYTPNSFTVKKGRPVKWVIDSQDSYSCASSILLAKYGINAVLKPGENVFNFTPEQAGNLKFSCGMGMYTGIIKVVD
jgi:sulfite exporter TauE/SafE/copper chaperone CopZ